MILWKMSASQPTVRDSSSILQQWVVIVHLVFKEHNWFHWLYLPFILHCNNFLVAGKYFSLYHIPFYIFLCILKEDKINMGFGFNNNSTLCSTLSSQKLLLLCTSISDVIIALNIVQVNCKSRASKGNIKIVLFTLCKELWLFILFFN